MEKGKYVFKLLKIVTLFGVVNVVVTAANGNEVVDVMNANGGDTSSLSETPKTNKNGKGNSSLVAGILVPLMIIIIAAAACFFYYFFFYKKKNANNNSSNNNENREYNKPLIANEEIAGSEYSRAETMAKEGVENGILVENYNSILPDIYPKGYARPTLKNALFTAKLKDKQVDAIYNTCKNAGHTAMGECFSSDGFTEDDAVALAMYTYDFGQKKTEYNPYVMINRSLAERVVVSLQKTNGLLYLVMMALRKLPRITGLTLYKGVKGKINFDESNYRMGNVITWPTLSSTSPDMNETKKMLAKGSSTGKATGTLFIIEGGWGYNIQPYSLFPNEAEIIIEPERQFKVNSVIQADLTVISLQMLDTPLSLPEVFGEGSQ